MKCFGQISNGAAIWTVMFFNTQESLKYEQLQCGTIGGDELFAGCDVDELVEKIWKIEESGQCSFMQMNLMMISGKLVRIQSSFDGKKVRVLRVDFDHSTFPSGLKGRWVDVVFDQPIRPRRALAVA